MNEFQKVIGEVKPQLVEPMEPYGSASAVRVEDGGECVVHSLLNLQSREGLEGFADRADDRVVLIEKEIAGRIVW